MKQLTLYIFLLITVSGYSQFSFDSILSQKPILKLVNDAKKKFRLQIIYTQITRDNNNVPSFKTYNYQVDSSNYFYCASLVKLPVSILALEKLNDLYLNKTFVPFENTFEKLSNSLSVRNLIMFTDSANACQHRVKKDTTSENGLPSIAQYIKRMALVSDNIAYGRVYEFLGVDYIHNRLSELGYKNARIINRFDGGCKGAEHLNTNPVSFYDAKGKLLYKQSQQISKRQYTSPIGVIKVGKAYLDSKNKKINEPKNFTNMNYLSLQNIHGMLQRLIFNDYYPKKNQYNLTQEDQAFLIKYLTMYPRESSHPTYPIKYYYDSYKKYLLFGDSKKTISDTAIKITNIVGQSYGFMVDCAYITNKTKHIEFILSAVIYTNENDIINDGKYEYNTIALPFLAELGRQIYYYELRNR